MVFEATRWDFMAICLSRVIPSGRLGAFPPVVVVCQPLQDIRSGRGALTSRLACIPKLTTTHIVDALRNSVGQSEF